MMKWIVGIILMLLAFALEILGYSGFFDKKDGDGNG